MKLKQQDVIPMVAQAIKFVQSRYDDFVAHLIDQGHPETAKAAQSLVGVEVETATMPDMQLEMAELADLTVAVLNYAHIHEDLFLAFLDEAGQPHLVPHIPQLDRMRQHFSSVHHTLMDLQEG